MQKFVFDPVFGPAAAQIVAEATDHLVTLYQRDMRLRDRKWDNLYTAPFPWVAQTDERFEAYLLQLRTVTTEGNPPVPVSPVLEGQAKSRDRDETLSPSHRSRRARPRNIARSRQAHYRHYRRMGMRPRDAARIAMQDEDRYRIGWNNHFSIMPLDAKGRPYARWPRD